MKNALKRAFSIALLGILIRIVSACGGGSGSGGAAPPQPSQPQAPQPTFTANPSIVPYGAAVTLQWNSLTASCVAAGGVFVGTYPPGINSALIRHLTRDTTFTLTCSGATAPQNFVMSATATVTPIGAVPLPTTDTVVSESLVSRLNYSRYNMKVADILWDGSRSRLLAVTNSDSSVNPNSLVSLNPVNQAIQSVSLGALPSAIALSGDNQFVYVGFAKNGLLQRYRANDLSFDRGFTMGTEFARVYQIGVSPIDSHVVGAIINAMSDSNDPTGLVIVDDNGPRANRMSGSKLIPPNTFPVAVTISDFEWASDGQSINALGSATAVQGIFHLAVDNSGVSFVSSENSYLARSGRKIADRLYTDSGRVYSLTGPVELLGRMWDYDGTMSFRTESPTRGKAFSVEQNFIPIGFADGIVINSHDLNTFLYVDSIVFHGVATFDGGKIIPWGTDGLAVASTDSLLIANGSFAAAGNVPPLSTQAAPVVAQNTSGSVSLQSRTFDMSARDIAGTGCGKLYVATHAEAPANPSSILELDPSTGTLLRSLFVRGEPTHLAISDDCSTLYAALDASNAIARINLGTMTVDTIIPLGLADRAGIQFVAARSISVAPSQPRTIAVARMPSQNGACTDTDFGLAIYDDLTMRPNVFQADALYSVKSVAFGAVATTVYGQQFDNFYEFSVTSDGVASSRVLFPSRIGTIVGDLGRDLRFDRISKRLYNSFGYVYDTLADKELSRISFVGSTATYTCGTPSASNISDTVSGKFFFVNLDTSYGLGIGAYDKATLSQLGRIDLPVVNHGPVKRVVRNTSNGIAVANDDGSLILFEGDLLKP